MTKQKKSVIAPVGFNFKRFPFEFREITTKANKNSKKKQANRLDRWENARDQNQSPFLSLALSLVRGKLEGFISVIPTPSDLYFCSDWSVPFSF